MDAGYEMEMLTNEIFTILENKFLFGNHLDHEKDLKSLKNTTSHGKVGILSIDGNGSTDGILAAKSLSYLEASLRRKHGNPDARIADFFDIVAGSGIGGILAALLFTKGNDGRPILTADQALQFLIQNRNKLVSSPKGIFRRKSRSSKATGKIFSQIFGESTLKDTLKPVLIACYDLSTSAPFLFSRADAFESDGFDFTIKEVCVATSATGKAFELNSIDKSTKIFAVDGGVSMNNPTAAAVTHVLNNKQEFPFCSGVEDLLVVSLGNGESSLLTQNMKMSTSSFINVAGDGASDMVDQAVSMSFGEFMTNNYVRIQANGSLISSNSDAKELVEVAEKMLKQKNVESVLFRGKTVVEKTNADKLSLFAGELIKEKERRKMSIFPTVLFKQVSPRSSSATTSTLSSSY